MIEDDDDIFVSYYVDKFCIYKNKPNFIIY